MFSNKLCQLLNIDYPVIQGGMAWISEANLAAAVSNAGGLGVIAAGNAEGWYVREQVQKIKEMTDKPYAVNMMMISPHRDEVAQVLIEEKVPVIITGAGSPEKYMADFKANGSMVIPVVASVLMAVRMEKLGADAVVAEGQEAGGHIGELTTMALIPQVVDAISIPVIGAGGIGDGRGMAAAAMLGAKGVQVGTAFLLAEECTVHENYKQKVIDAKDTDTIVTGRIKGSPVRGLKNKFARNFIKVERQENITAEEIEELGIGALRKAAAEGDMVDGTIMAGQIAGLLKEVKPAKAVIEDMYNEAIHVIKEIGKEI